jgi:hypothetical protein
MIHVKLTMSNDELGITETLGLTDADWAEINKLRRVRETKGQRR